MRVTNARHYDEPRDSISHDWIRCLGDWGWVPALIPNGVDDPARFLDGLEVDVLILTGGDDLGASPARDKTETTLLSHALEVGLPTLGVCRGMQLINRHFGGDMARIEGHVARPHVVSFAPEWHTVYGREVTVNSYHELGISAGSLAKPLSGFAFDADGCIEGLVHPDHGVAGVMWHPERNPGSPGDAVLLSNLAGDGAFWA